MAGFQLIHPTAVIGGPPESRDWDPTMPALEPTIHPTARIGPFVTIDAGMRQRTNVGPGAWLFAHSHVGHDAYIGENVEISTGAVIGGHAIVCAGAQVKLNATVLPYRIVGAGAVVGAGALVTKDVPAGETWVGNPARKLEDSERDPRPHSMRTAA